MPMMGIYMTKYVASVRREWLFYCSSTLGFIVKKTVIFFNMNSWLVSFKADWFPLCLALNEMH